MDYGVLPFRLSSLQGPAVATAVVLAKNLAVAPLAMIPTLQKTVAKASVFVQYFMQTCKLAGELVIE